MRLLSTAFLAFLGLFAMSNVIGELIAPRFNAGHWWLHLWFLPKEVVQGILPLSSVALLTAAFGPHGGVSMRRWRAIWLVSLAAISIFNAFHTWWLWSHDRIQLGCPVPLSLLLGIGLLAALALRGSGPARGGRWLECAVLGAFVAACGLAFPLAQMLCFGKTDYRRGADAVVVFGARAYADGRLSHALRDRVRTGCRLYLDGFARKVVFSGGPGDGDIHETEAMRRAALEMGVADEDIVLDRDGVNTGATVRNTMPVFAGMGASRVLAVSHFYHLPRIKMAYQRAGCQVYTVPAEESYFLRAMPYYMLREIAAFWLYYVRA